MDINKVDIDGTNISLDLSDATQAVKENRFQDAILLLKRIYQNEGTLDFNWLINIIINDY